MSERILIIDDEEDIRFSLSGVLEDEGFLVSEAGDGSEGLAFLRQNEVGLVFLDIWMPGMDGMAVLDEIRVRFPDLPVIMISGHGTIETAVKAIKKGAYDFIEKPLSLENVLITVNKALEFSSLKQENRVLRSRIRDSHVQRVTGAADSVVQLRRMIAQVAPTETWVLITGENGTGKEIVARSIHNQSSRSELAMVAVNCAAIPEELIESELFGHEKGSFTGADKAKKGKFEQAHGSTLFLDEIGDMSLKTQAKILRILQEQQFERVGGNRTLRVDVRVVAATNKNLREEIREGRFREDLYYRLNVFPLEVPPLRERVRDIPDILEEFVSRMGRETSFKPCRFSREAVAVLQRYSWPGNVRELKNFVERMFILASGKDITPDMLPREFQDPGAVSSGESKMPGPDRVPDDFKSARAEFESWFLSSRLKECEGNISRLADSIGLERSYLYRKLKGYGILQ